MTVESMMMEDNRFWVVGCFIDGKLEFAHNEDDEVSIMERREADEFAVLASRDMPGTKIYILEVLSSVSGLVGTA